MTRAAIEDRVLSGLYDVVTYVPGFSACAGAVCLLRHSWRSKTVVARRSSVAGWLTLAVAVMLLCLWRGIAIGTVAALLAFSLSGLVAVLAGAERRVDRTRPARVAESESRPRSRWRGWARGMTAFLLAMFAAAGMGAAFTSLPVGAPADRVSIGSLIVPFLWAAFIIWALADRKILRPVLGMTSALVASGATIAAGLLA